MTTPRNFARMAGLHVGARIQFPRVGPLNNRREGRTVTFYANTTWTAPLWAKLLSRIIGKGSDGMPASGANDYRAGYTVTKQVGTYAEFTNGGSPQFGPRVYQGEYVGAKPADYCGENTYWPSSGYIKSTTCYSFEATTVDVGDYSPATAGASATGFGQVLAGGPTGQPASISLFRNVPITPGASYVIVVPPGGQITIEY